MNQNTVDALIGLISNPDLLPQRKKHYGVFYGEVVDIHDPAKIGRIKVRTPHYISYPEEMIPWAVYSSPGNGGSDNIGFYFLPPVGSTVTVIFVGGDPEFPVWMGGVPGIPDGVAETHVTKLDATQPYGEPIENWDYTRFNSITTPDGHRIILDDNRTIIEDGTEFSARRILIESSDGHFIRMIESKHTDPDPTQLNALLEIGTVREDRSWVRRLALDNNDETITLTGPDAVDDGVHEIEISSVSDYIRAKTSRSYTFILDDDNEVIELFTTKTDESSKAHSLRMDNPDKRITMRTYDDMFSMMMWDHGAGYAAITSPWAPQHVDRKANISIEDFYSGSGDPVVVISAGSDGVSSNGLMADPGANGRPQSVKLFGKTQAGSAGSAPASSLDVIELITAPKNSNREEGEVFIGRSNNYIRLLPVSRKATVDSGEILLAASGVIRAQSSTDDVIIQSPTNVRVNGGPKINLVATEIYMQGPVIHDYFKHVHEVRIGEPDPNNPSAPVGTLTVYVAGSSIPVVHGSLGPVSDPFDKLYTRTPIAF